MTVTPATPKAQVIVAAATPRSVVAQDEDQAGRILDDQGHDQEGRDASRPKSRPSRSTPRPTRRSRRRPTSPRPKPTKAEQEAALAAAIHDLGSIKKGQRHV